VCVFFVFVLCCVYGGLVAHAIISELGNEFDKAEEQMEDIIKWLGFETCVTVCNL